MKIKITHKAIAAIIIIIDKGFLTIVRARALVFLSTSGHIDKSEQQIIKKFKTDLGYEWIQLVKIRQNLYAVGYQFP